MAVWGIIAEYHPFHNGHQYQLDWIRKQDPEATIVVVMSGNFMQRGIPAMMDKWMRAEMALAGGADLIMELPAVFAVQAADFFARGGISVLSQIHVDYLCFGSEEGETGDYIRDAQLFLENESLIFSKMRTEEFKKMAFPKAVATIMSELSLKFSVDLAEPNNLLGFSYAKEILKQNSSLMLRPMVRLNAHHRELQVKKGSSFASGSAIRQALLNSQDVSSYIPKATNKLIENNSAIVTWDNLWPYLKYELLVRSVDELGTIYQMNNGLENLYKQAARSAKSYDEFISKVKNKAYTQARIERLNVYALLGWEQEEIKNKVSQPAHLRVLGFSDRGREHLSQLKGLEVRPDTIINQKNNQKYQRDIQAGEIYQLGMPECIKKQDYTRKPLQKH